jgi:thioredoxin 1
MVHKAKKTCRREESDVIIEITDHNFDKEVLECEKLVFACFTTKWCHTCFPTCLIAAKLAEEYDRRVKFARVDTEESTETAKRYHITAVPTILIFQNSQTSKRLLSFQERSYLKHILDGMAAEQDLSHE